MSNSSNYLLSIIGLIIELVGVLGLFASGYKWIKKSDLIKPLAPYGRKPSDTLESVVHNLPVNKIAEEVIQDNVNENKKVLNRSRIWIAVIVLGSLIQIWSTYQFYLYSLHNS